MNRKLIEAIAKICHEANRAYCQTIGDDSQVAWDSCSEWQRESAFNGVLSILLKPETSPGDSHASWLAEKYETGWSYGEKKDPEKKLHPCMVPFAELPIEQQVKDHIFVAIAKTIIGLQGKK